MPVLSRHPGIFFQDRFYPAQVGTQFRAFTGLLQPVPVSHKPRSDRLWQMLSNGFELTATHPDAVRSGTSSERNLRSRLLEKARRSECGDQNRRRLYQGFTAGVTGEVERTGGMGVIDLRWVASRRSHAHSTPRVTKSK